MSLETATYLNQLVATNPPGTDDYRTADDHIRLIKSVLLATFPNITGAVTVTEAQLNALAGMTTLGNFPSGTHILFVDQSPPSGWTIDTSISDKLLRVNSAGGTSGGTWDTLETSGTTGPHAITVDELPALNHNYDILVSYTGGNNAWYTAGSTTNEKEVANGGVSGGINEATSPGQGHTHNFRVVTDSAWRPAYVDVIIGVKS